MVLPPCIGSCGALVSGCVSGTWTRRPASTRTTSTRCASCAASSAAGRARNLQQFSNVAEPVAEKIYCCSTSTRVPVPVKSSCKYLKRNKNKNYLNIRFNLLQRSSCTTRNIKLLTKSAANVWCECWCVCPRTLSHGSLRDHLNRSHKSKREEFVTYEYVRLTYYR